MKRPKSGKRKPAREPRKPPVQDNPAQAQQRRRQLATHYAARYRSR
jgi:hypothetical protein